MKKILLLICLSILLISITCVSAGPMRNITIHVEDATGTDVINAQVHMYSNPLQYYDFEGSTDENGNITFEVDARVCVPNKIPAARGTGGTFSQSKEIEMDSEDDRSIHYVMYRPKRFYFEIISAGSSVSFGNLYENYTFSLNKDYNFDFNVTNDFYVYPFPNYYVNEYNSSKIIIDFDDYIISSGGFDELDIIFDIEFSDIDAYFNYDNETHEMEVNFLPEINLSYHINNEIQIELTIEKNQEIYEQVFFYSYVPACRVMIGQIKDHYTDETISNSQINSTTHVGELMFTDNNEIFLGVYEYGSDGDPIYITKNDYITSERYMRLIGGDQIVNFTLIPELVNGGTLHDDLFDQVFRWYNSATMRESEYPEDIITYSICTAGFNGYVVEEEELEKTNFSLNQVAAFTNNYHKPFEGYFEYRNNQVDCIVDELEMGYISIIWDGNLASNESTIEYLHWGNRMYGAIISLGGNSQSIITQKIIQVISTPNIQYNLTDSVFSPMGADVISLDDLNWGRRLYMRRAKNMAPDTDWDLYSGETDNKMKITTAKYSNGKVKINTKSAKKVPKKIIQLTKEIAISNKLRTMLQLLFN